MSSKHTEKITIPACHLCKEKFAHGETPTPSGICHKCQAKIGVIILIIMVITTGMLFFGLL